MTLSIMRRAAVTPQLAPVALTYPEVVLATPGLQHYWTLDDGSLPALVTDQCDGVNLGYVGYIYEGSALPMGNDARHFTGSFPSFLYSAFPETYLGSDPLSVEMWMLISSTGAPGTALELGDSESGTSTNRKLSLVADPSGGGSLIYDVKLGIGSTATLGAYTPDDLFHHVVLISDAVSPYCLVTLYVDGVSVNSISEPRLADGVDYYWRIGSGVAGNFVGQIAHVAIYTAELSADTVAAHYAAGVGKQITTLFQDDFETGDFTGLITSYGPSIVTTTPRHGMYCAQVTSGYLCALYRHLAAGVPKVVTRVGVKVVTPPTTGATEVTSLLNASSVNGVAVYVSSTGQLSLCFKGGSAVTGPTIDTNWHLIELQADYSGTTWTCDWKVDGALQTQASIGGMSASTIAYIVNGVAFAVCPDFTARYDDWIMGSWVNAATDWYGDV